MSDHTLKRAVGIAQLVIAVSLLIVVFMEYVRPFLTEAYFRDDYMRLAGDCDQAMHDEAALRPGTAGATRDPALSLSADVALAVCHDYDMLRKWLLAAGVSEETLALRGVEAIENERIPLTRMVAPHRMDRF
jgi:hypothetical protein